jgi:RHS repeat-associated protein
MGYHLTTSPDQPATRSHASPKTHTPLPRLQERGHRFYSPAVGRWISRDPLASLLLSLRSDGADPVYVFVRNDEINHVDALGLLAIREPYSKKCGCNADAIMKTGCEAAKKSFDIYGRAQGEGCGRVCCNKATGETTWTGPEPGVTRTTVVIIDGRRVIRFERLCDYQTSQPCPKGFDESGHYHSHPDDGSDRFSDKDYENCRGRTCFVWTSGGCRSADPYWDDVGPVDPNRFHICDVDPASGQLSNCHDLECDHDPVTGNLTNCREVPVPSSTTPAR